MIEGLELRVLLAANAIVTENQLPGTPESQWEVAGAGDATIQGFATNMSVNVGTSESFKIDDYQLAPIHIDIYRLGYYQGNGARYITTIASSQVTRQNQPNPLTDSKTGLVDCGNWGVSATWSVPSTAVSGVYAANVVREDTGGKFQILFVVRNDAGHSDLLFQTSDATWEAYNNWGNSSLYGYRKTTGVASTKVSYNRPFTTRGDDAEDYFFNAEYPMVRFLERNGYDVSYFTDVDSDRNGSLIKNHKVFMSVGHDEYWSGGQRTNVESARDAGVNLAFFSGNEVFWKTRWENSIDSSKTSYRTLVCYKETSANAVTDPADPPIWTGTWRDPRFSPPADGGRPENALSGQLFMVNGERTDAIQVPAAYAKLRIWRNTSIANLTGNQVATFPTGTLGYEWDEAVDNSVRPAGEFELSSTTVTMTGNYVLKDYGTTYGPGTVEHNLSMYRAASGALVFGAGTVQWSWGLDADHDRTTPAADVRMQQGTVNVLADMGAQAGTLMSGLAAATQSTDHTAPTSTVTSPAGGNLSVTKGRAVTVSGTATDGGGGVVAGVEVSVDGGATWHPAGGTGSWSYTWTPGASGTVQVLSRAVDDSGNLETPGGGGGGGGGGTGTPPPAGVSIWSSTAIPKVAADPDAGPVELGVKFRSDVAGTITGIRFYKSSTNTGTHIGNLWSSTGQLLATATFVNETASGWENVVFATPVAIQPNTTYVASYHTDTGHYSEDAGYFTAAGVDNAPLHALKSGVDGVNGVYTYGATAFPTKTFTNDNYWVDVFFNASGGTDTTPPSVTARTPASGATGVSAGTNVTATFSESIQSSSLVFEVKSQAGASVAGTVTYDDPSKTATFTPSASLTAGTTYNVSVSAKDLAGNQMSAVGWSFTVGSAQTTGLTIFGNAVPKVAADPDAVPTELGVKFRSDVAGTVTGIRFYKSTTNTGTHIGNLWSSTGQLLATGTFTGESASGWQTLTFATPVTIQANTTYVASYHTDTGHYSEDAGYFKNAGVDSGPLHALKSGVDGVNGVYTYGATAFPTKTFSSDNYWVDVTFNVGSGSDTTPPAVTGTVPTSGATGVSTTAAVAATFSESVQSASVVFTLKNASTGQAVAGSVSYNDANKTATFTPSAALAAGTAYTASVTAKDQAGNAMAAPFTWTFTTAASGVTQTIFGAATPVTAADPDKSAIEVGVKFTPDVNGMVTGIRFYKGTTNTGTHIGNLWSSTGQLLATGTFTNETASGWQTLTFAAPVAVTAGTVYVASYFAPNGHYAADDNYFTGQAGSGDVRALADGASGANGVYRYGTSSGFPVTGYLATNYWVDVMFVAQ